MKNKLKEPKCTVYPYPTEHRPPNVKTVRYLVYSAAVGAEVEIIMLDGLHWFRMSDIMDFARTRQQTTTIDRFDNGESRKLHCRGSLVRFVSYTGLIAVLTPKRDFSKGRQLIAELLQTFRPPLPEITYTFAAPKNSKEHYEM